MFDRAALQTLVTKLDTKAITLAYAKRWLKDTYRIEIKAGNINGFLKECVKHIVKT